MAFPAAQPTMSPLLDCCTSSFTVPRHQSQLNSKPVDPKGGLKQAFQHAVVLQASKYNPLEWICQMHGDSQA